MIWFLMKLVYDTVYISRYLKDKNGYFFFKANDFISFKIGNDYISFKIGNDHNAGLSYIYVKWTQCDVKFVNIQEYTHLQYDLWIKKC